MKRGMKTSEIIYEISRRTNLPKIKVSKIVHATIETIREAIIKGEKVKIRNLGTWKLGELSPRTIKHPRTGEILNLKIRKKIKFVPSGSAIPLV